MCGRYSLIKLNQLLEYFPWINVPPGLRPRYNIAPTQPIVVVRAAASGRGRELVPMRWGFVPAWAKDPKNLPLLIMARADGIADKPAFKNAFRRRRCLIPASGFYEWQARGKGPKQPYAVRPAARGLVAFAGLWETWCGNDGSEIDTAAIVTTDANGTLCAVHDRMPVILSREGIGAWLDVASVGDEEAMKLVRPCPDEWLDMVPVSTRVNKVANDDPSLQEPLPHPDLKPETETGKAARPRSSDEDDQGRLF